MINESIDFQDASPHTRILLAARFAIEVHQGQVRKIDGQPYFFHPLAVGRLLLEAGAEADVVAAGILHDTVEDTQITLADIEVQFGKRVADWVACVTERDKSIPWRERKDAYLAVLGKAPAEVLMISLADKRDNLRSLRSAVERLGVGVWDKFNRPKPEQRWYHENLISIYENRIGESAGRGMLEAYRRDFERLFDQ
jgi:(p)ppGpp synthase/HD superfamily hydrolase